MSALDSAMRVMEWAAVPRTVPPPRGDLRAPEQLAKPSKAARQTLAELVAVSTARLRLSSPPFDDDKPLPLGGLVLAATLAVHDQPQLAQWLHSAVPSASSPLDWVVRHSLLAPALPFLSKEFAEGCRLLSPMTALWDRPLSEQESQTVALAQRCLKHRAERLALTLEWACPSNDLLVRQWRHRCLEIFRVGSETEQRFVLDVYEAMMIHHESKALEQIEAATAVFHSPEAASDEKQLRNALSIAHSWGPLWAMERNDNDRLRHRDYLGYTYRKGIRLFKLSQQLSGGVHA